MHTAMDPALHMLTPHNVRFRDQFYAVDEDKRPVKESFSTPECALYLLHAFAAPAYLYFSFKSCWLCLWPAAGCSRLLCQCATLIGTEPAMFCPLGENPAFSAKVRQYLCIISGRPHNAEEITCCLQSHH